jgi:hypothetical protein
MSDLIKDATARAELLELAIEHYCTTDRAMDEKVKLLNKAENYMKYIKQLAALNRQRTDEHNEEAIGF